MVIMRKDQNEDTFVSAKCLSYFLSKLEQTMQNPPTAENIRLVDVLMKNIDTSYEIGLKRIYDYAMLWRRAELWDQLLSCCCKSERPISNDFLDKAAEAVSIFKIERCKQT
jgi:hypothetical protein